MRLSVELERAILGRTIHGAGGEVLLTPGTPLTGAYIERLCSMGILRVYVLDSGSADVEICEAVSEGTRLNALKVMESLVRTAGGRTLSTRLGLNPTAVSHAVDSIIIDVMTSPLTIAACADLRTYDEYTYRHSVNTCVIALQLGRRAGLRGESLRTLGLGALLHDVGKVHLPTDVLNKPGRLEPHEWELVKKHSRLGWLALKGLVGVNPVARSVSLQHHERNDGTGYPRGLAGTEICWPSRYVAVADVFDALTSDRPYRNGLPNDVVLRDYLHIGNPAYDSEVLAALHRVACPYPPGRTVTLSDGRSAIVVRVTEAHPDKPILRTLGESSVTIDMSKRDDLSIASTAMQSDGPTPATTGGEARQERGRAV